MAKCESFAAKARHLVQIQAPTEAGDAAGDVADSWATITNGTCYAIITPVSGREAIYSQQIQSQHTHKIPIRYLATLMPPPVGCKHRVLFGSRALNITSVRNLNEESQYLELLCDEGVST